MFSALIYILIGAFIGWHFPEPQWAKSFKEMIKDLYKDLK
jgi:hypothetical protein